MEKELKNYIVLGDNNFWYAETEKMSLKQAKKQFQRICKEIKKGGYYSDEEFATPFEIYLVEANLIETATLK